VSLVLGLQVIRTDTQGQTVQERQSYAAGSWIQDISYLTSDLYPPDRVPGLLQ